MGVDLLQRAVAVGAPVVDAVAPAQYDLPTPFASWTVADLLDHVIGAQQRFVEAELASARNDPDVDFIVVSMHQCAFSSSTKHGSDDGVRRAWFELFHRHSVDLVLGELGDRTAERALDDGEEPGAVWTALCDAVDVPPARRFAALDQRRRA